MFCNVQLHCTSVLQKVDNAWNLLAFSPPYGELPPYAGSGYLLCPHWHTFCWFCKMGNDVCQLPLCKVFVKVIVMNCSSNCEFESYRSNPNSKSAPTYVHFTVYTIWYNENVWEHQRLVFPNSNYHLMNDKVFWLLYERIYIEWCNPPAKLRKWLVVCTVYGRCHTERSPLPSVPPHVCMSVCCTRPGHWRTNCSYKRQPTTITGIGWVWYTQYKLL